MPNLNQCTFIGHLGRDPESRHTGSGAAVCNIVIACSEYWKDKNTGEKQEHTEWVRCSAFGKQAEIIAQYFKKGDPIFVQGRQRTRKWQAQDGTDRYSTEINIDKFEFLARKGDAQPQQQTPSQAHAQPRQSETSNQAPAQPQAGGFDDDIPFASKHYAEGG